MTAADRLQVPGPIVGHNAAANYSLATKPYAPWATDSWASCTAAYATTPTTANTPPGRTEPPTRLDDLQPWDVYSGSTHAGV
jgi:hypothetical protein